MEVGKIILAQLGGARKLGAMIGAHSFAAGDFGAKGQGLSFKIKAKNKLGVKAIMVFLNGLDLYNVEFLAIRGMNVKNVGQHENLYAEDLKRLIEQELGIYLSF